MSKAYELIAESLNEIIEDFEKNNGKNLNRKTLTEEKNISAKFEKNSFNHSRNKNFFVNKIDSVKI